jgi:hypothetical protein
MEKYSRRARSLQQARKRYSRAIDAGKADRAFRTASWIESFEAWLDANAPFPVETY